MRTPLGFFLLLMLFLWGFVGPAQAANLKIIGPCQEQALHQLQVPSQATTLGDLTVKALAENRIPFQGDRTGIKSIENSPVGDEALEILSDSQMRAYGWCVSVNGVEPGVMPDEVPLRGDEDIVWFYAYTLYDRGTWKDVCTPSYKNHSLPVCQH